MEYTKRDINDIVLKQREYFKTNETLDVNFRINQLKKLKEAVIYYEKEIADALHTDLGRHYVESYFCDTGAIILELNETIRGLRKWAKPEKHFSGFVCFPSVVTTVYKMPYGTVLIVAPSNFPFLLSLGVLVAAIAGGNTACIKVSSKSKASTKVIEKIVQRAFKDEYVKVIDGNHEVADYCLEAKFDKIFYTGSPKVAKHVVEVASRDLVPVAIEAGGENGNWCIIRKDADLKDAARKIAFFKVCNSGQICINVNQVAVAKEVASEFIEYLKEAFIKQIGNDPINNDEYDKLIDERAYDKCANEAIIYQDRVIFGGRGNRETCKFEPTIIYPVNIDEEIVKKELFSPLLPIVEYEDKEVEELLDVIAEREHSLALYVFTKDIDWANRVMSTQQFGGGCINEVMLHLAVKGAPFNGVGHSGMGAYHGEWGFREFTHPQTVLRGSSKFNLDLREHPYNETKAKILKMFEK